MKQRVNFYRGGSKQPVRPLTAVWMAWAAAIFILLLVAVSGVQAYLNHRLHDRVAAAQKRNQQRSTELQALLARYPEPRPDPALAKQADRLQAEIESLRVLLNRLEGDELLARGGFSAHFEGLARQRLQGVWLRAVRLEQGGREIVLSGNALERDDIPEWMAGLSREPVFQQRTFSGLTLAEPRQGQGRIEFNLSTRPPEAEKNGRS
jgi:Tfp pilus assembly protein PilN